MKDLSATKLIALVGMCDGKEQYLAHLLANRMDVEIYSIKKFYSHLFEATLYPDLCFLDMSEDVSRSFMLLGSLKTLNIPTICILPSGIGLALELRCLSGGAYDVMYWPESKSEILKKTDFIFHNTIFEQLVFDKHVNREKHVSDKDNIDTLMHQILSSLSVSIDAKDSYTQGHSLRVALYSTILGKECGLDDESLTLLHYSALMHDIGKIGMPDAVLRKPGKLSDEERKIIQTHPTIGYDILKTITLMPDMSLVARFHHERWDGTGYPDGLDGVDIPLYARIVSIADAFDAMTSERSYRKPLTFEEAGKEILACKGTQFDPQLVEISSDIIQRYISNGKVLTFDDVLSTTA
ncbi:HD-GYP domain-containing protein [Butyrivibrio hungatei]|uniref:HD family phosphohydrolase n=1 Tax=Butyrivibrio hungatei TaxID=185008 RepID=A0A1D9P5R4_9FIRM|nr:HD-GYP domain-containing protein [Butyrivibrio hungatei]AOZ97910.1 HD family phosphohydrolase [Butyrivibrio hungatei]